MLALGWLTLLAEEATMTKTLVSEVHIDAAPQRVWQVLGDLAAYREWNPFIVEAAGRPEVGERLTLRIQPVNGRAMTLRPTVTAAREGELLRWLGSLGMAGIFDGEHSFGIEADGDGTRLVQQETFRGVLVPFFARTL